MKHYIDTVKNRMSCLSWVKVEGGLAYTTDLKSWAWEPTDLADGYYVLEDLKHGITLPKELRKDTFPQTPEAPSIWFPLSSDQAWAILDAFSCASDDETRWYMNGVYLDPEGDVVATDGRRLTVEPVGLDARQGDAIIPYRPVLRRFIKPDRKRPRMEIARDEKNIWFRRDQSVLGMTLIEGMYPNWRRVLPDLAVYGSLFFELPDDTTLSRALYLTGRGRRIFVDVDGLVTVESPDTENRHLPVGQVRANLSHRVAIDARFIKDARRSGGHRALVPDVQDGHQKAFVIPLPTGGRQIIMSMQLD